MTPWQDYLPELRVLLPECPDVVIRAAVRDSAIRFCEESQCWQDMMDLSVMPGDRDVPISTNDSDIAVVCPLWIGDVGREVVEKSVRWLDQNVPGWRHEDGDARYYTVPVRGRTIWFAPHPSVAITFDMQAALKPGPEATQGPDDLFTEYKEAVQGGALSRLALIPNKAWSNAGLAALGAAQYTTGVNNASLRVARGNTRAAIRTRMSYRV